MAQLGPPAAVGRVAGDLNGGWNDDDERWLGEDCQETDTEVVLEAGWITILWLRHLLYVYARSELSRD